MFFQWGLSVLKASKRSGWHPLQVSGPTYSSFSPFLPSWPKEVIFMKANPAAKTISKITQDLLRLIIVSFIA